MRKEDAVNRPKKCLALLLTAALRGLLCASPREQRHRRHSGAPVIPEDQMPGARCGRRGIWSMCPLHHGRDCPYLRRVQGNRVLDSLVEETVMT